jgi:hypothetical protein
MARGTFGAASAMALLLATALNLIGINPAAAGPPFDEARPLFNPRYAPPYPEGPWGHVPLCQILLRVSPARAGVTSDDIWYCYLPPYASRHPSDPCTCAQTGNGARFLRSGMVVWTPGWWRYPVYPHP